MKKKLKKLFRSPLIFWRDFLLKRAPIDYGNGVLPLRAEGGKENRGSRPISGDEFIAKDFSSVAFPIDIVYTWVDGDDQKFQKDKSKYLNSSGFKKEATDHARFKSLDELKYSLRSLEAYAPWVNKIYIVTNGQIPKWLNVEHEKISIVRHEEIIDAKFLPTFNSHVIESALHKIEGLSENYVYFNDDVLLTRPISPEHFFASNGTAKVFVTQSALSFQVKTIYDTPTQWAAKNARDLLYSWCGKHFYLLFSHTFHPQLKSINFFIESQWKKEIELFRSNKFRGSEDLPIATFLHHYVAFMKGRATGAKTSCMYFNVRSPSAMRYYEGLLARKGGDKAPYSMCLNDTFSKNQNQLKDYEFHLRAFLNSYFPFESSFEMLDEFIAVSL